MTARSSFELRGEGLKRVSHATDELLKRFEDRRSLSELYERSRDVLHFHVHGLTVRPVCLEYRPAVVAIEGARLVRAESDTGLGEMGEERKVSMLVWVGEVAESLRPVASIERLQFLDEV